MATTRRRQSDRRRRRLSKLSYQPQAWYKATVPGTVLTSLVNDGVYPEPLYGENNRPDKIPETLCRTPYWYRTTFTVPPPTPGRRVWLNFDGINYTAEVWVNGHDLGSIKGAFARGLFDITHAVTAGAPTRLAVQILPPAPPRHPARADHRRRHRAQRRHHGQDGPTFLCTIGWDWIPAIRDRDIGIWQKVSLSATGPVIVEEPLRHHRPSPAPHRHRRPHRLSHPQQRHRQAADRHPDRHLRRHHLPQPPSPLAARATPARHPYPRRHARTPLLHPRLWWPNGYGPQNLYTLHLRFVRGRRQTPTPRTSPSASARSPTTSPAPTT